jgi:type I restriction enzyme S subunit
MAELISLHQGNIQTLITQHIDLWTGAVKDKSSAGRGGSSKRELYGIKKLRELILELAVRGKLVAQDPNDEPASVILERIAAEKAELIKQGKIKKPKKLPEISEEEKPFELPKRWEWCKLGHLVEMYNGRAFKSSEWSDKGLPIVRIQNLNNENAEFNYFSGELTAHHKIDNGSFLISWSGTPGTSFGAFVWQRGEAALNQHINNCVFFDQAPNLMFMKLAVNGCMSYLISSAQGAVGLKHVTKGTLENSIIAMPPEHEQARIVAKVDVLMDLCDQLEQQTESSLDAHQTLVQTMLDTLLQSADAEELEQNWQRLSAHFDLLFTTEQSIDQLKQTILQLAVMGKLVPQDPNDEPASELLKRIAAEKEELIKQKKIKKQKPLPPISEDEKPFQLPKGWEWCRFDCASLASGSGWSPQCLATPREGEGWGVLKVSAVTWDVFNPHENKALPDHLEAREEHEVKSGDFLISRANTADLVAKAVVVPDDVPKKLMMSDKIIRFKLHNEVVGHFLNLVNNSSFSRTYYQRVAGGTSSSMKNVSREQIRSLMVPLPPKEEQKRVMTKVDKLMILCDQLKAKLADSRNAQLNLTDALVAQAV